MATSGLGVSQRDLIRYLRYVEMDYRGELSSEQQGLS